MSSTHASGCCRRTRSASVGPSISGIATSVISRCTFWVSQICRASLGRGATRMLTFRALSIFVTSRSICGSSSTISTLRTDSFHRSSDSTPPVRSARAYSLRHPDLRPYGYAVPLVLILAFPRVVLALLFLLSNYLERAYHGLLLPLLGFIFLPVTTIVYAWLVNTHCPLDGINLLYPDRGVLIDAGGFGGGEWHRRAPVIAYHTLHELQPLDHVRLLGALACLLSQAPRRKELRRWKKKAYGKMPEGAAVDLYTLSNANGMQAGIITYGGAVVSLTAPDKNGKYADVVLGHGRICRTIFMAHPTSARLLAAMEIASATRKFNSIGKTYTLPNNNGNTLHGGIKGFDKSLERQPGDRRPSARTDLRQQGWRRGLSRHADGESRLHSDRQERTEDRLHRDHRQAHRSEPDQPFLLQSGRQGEGDILEHQVMIHADRFTPVDAGLIPTGELKAREGHAVRFHQADCHRRAHRCRTTSSCKFGKGYDHNWVLNTAAGGLTKAAEVYEPETGRVMEVWTTEPGLQFYTGNFLDGTLKGKGGKPTSIRSGFCMETQHFPIRPTSRPSPPRTEARRDLSHDDGLQILSAIETPPGARRYHQISFNPN